MIAGLGFNVINYCCNTCEEHGIVEVASNSCGELHHSAANCCESEHKQYSENTNHDLTCTNISHHPDSCHLLRVNVETPTIVVNNIEKTPITSFELLIPILLHTYAYIPIFEHSIFKAYSPPDTPLLAGRTILTAKSVLTI